MPQFQLVPWRQGNDGRQGRDVAGAVADVDVGEKFRPALFVELVQHDAAAIGDLGVADVQAVDAADVVGVEVEASLVGGDVLHHGRRVEFQRAALDGRQNQLKTFDLETGAGCARLGAQKCAHVNGVFDPTILRQVFEEEFARRMPKIRRGDGKP